ncbi:OsmC family protein [Streptomyces sp. NPDC001380]|uniref:OsmC family protein n=1 Tax=Streptomyces sp. NPDC001380 TaxID=3364566 RepID=UPI0036967B27
MTTTHTYDVTVAWTGNLGTGTDGYRSYARDHEVRADGPPPLPGSSDPAFRGDPARWNPEQLLVASLSQCHMLWYLHLCAAGGVVVTAYEDRAHGVLAMDGSGGGGRPSALSPVRRFAGQPPGGRANGPVVQGGTAAPRRSATSPGTVNDA